jgi:hypothetical protein
VALLIVRPTAGAGRTGYDGRDAERMYLTSSAVVPEEEDERGEHADADHDPEPRRLSSGSIR